MKNGVKCFQETWARSSNHTIYKCLLETFKTKAGWVKNLLKKFSFNQNISRDLIQVFMQKQVEVKNILNFKNNLYSVQKQGEFKIVFVKESFDMFVCREAAWGHIFLLGIPDFYLIKCGGGLGDLLTVN